MMDREAEQRRVDPKRLAEFVIQSGNLARSGCPPKLPKKGSIARLVIDCGERARGRKPDDAE
jgi:hypothetical protein